MIRIIMPAAANYYGLWLNPRRLANSYFSHLCDSYL